MVVKEQAAILMQGRSGIHRAEGEMGSFYSFLNLLPNREDVFGERLWNVCKCNADQVICLQALLPISQAITGAEYS